FVSETLAGYVGSHHAETVTVIHWHFASATIVKPERDFVKISKRMKRLNRNISSANRALCETPEILVSVGMHLAAHVLNRVVNNLMRVIGFQAIVGKQSIGVQSRTRRDMLPYFCLKSFLLAIWYNHGFDSAVSS